MPMMYKPGVAIVNDAPARPAIWVPVLYEPQLQGVDPLPVLVEENGAALFVLVWDWLTVTTWFGTVVVILPGE